MLYEVIILFMHMIQRGVEVKPPLVEEHVVWHMIQRGVEVKPPQWRNMWHGT